ncbi:Rrf2 family transcriptional regulator [bacterium]|nr:Rrf2 family transcriptional regulator [bacterium]
MKLPTKIRYGLRLLIDLGLHSEGSDPIPLRSIGYRQKISRKYLEQILIPLLEHDIVRSVRGVKGGYLLARSASEISVVSIFEALGEKPALCDCIDHPEICRNARNCVTRMLWIELGDLISHKLASISLQELIDQQEHIKGDK